MKFQLQKTNRKKLDMFPKDLIDDEISRGVKLLSTFLSDFLSLVGSS